MVKQFNNQIYSVFLFGVRYSMIAKQSGNISIIAPHIKRASPDHTAILKVALPNAKQRNVSPENAKPKSIFMLVN